MSKRISSQTVIEQYIKSCAILKDCTLSGDYKRGNREGKKLVKIFKILESNLDLAKNSLPHLFTHDNVVTRTKAAAHCIALNIYINEAVTILENASVDKANGVFGFNAKMTLYVWHEQGFLSVYPKLLTQKSDLH